MLILKQNAANTVPTPPAGKGTIFLDDSDTLSVKTSDGNVETFPTVAASNAQVVFINGTALSGEAAFTYDFNNNVLNVTGNIAAGNIKTDNLLYANGTPWDLQQPGGSNTQIQFNDADQFGGSAAFTFNKSSNLVSMGGALSVTGNANVGNLGTAGQVIASGNVTGNYFIGNGSQLTGIDATAIQNGTANVRTFNNGNVTISAAGTANVVVVTSTGANISGTANITGNANVGNLGTTELAVSGNAIISGNLTVDGNLVYVNVETVAVEDPIIQLQTGPNGATPSSNSGKDVGTALNYYDSQARVAFMGWDVSNAEFGLASQASISSEVVTFSTYGNLRVGNLVGATLVAGTLTTAAQPNVTSVGTLTGLDVNGNITAANITANTGVFTGNGSGLTSITGANVTGQVGNALVAGTVYTNAQPNITSVGTLTSLAVSGNSNVTNLGASGTVTVTGNVSAGNLSTGGTLSVTGNANVGNIGAGAGVYTANVTAANIYANSGTVGASLLTGTLTTASQPNVTSVGILSALDVTGNIAAGGVKTNNLYYANGNPWDLELPGGSNTQIQFNDANSFGGSAAFTFNKSSNVVTLSGNLSASNANLGNLVTANIANLVDLNVSGNANIGGGTGGNISGANVIAANTFIGNLQGIVANGNSNVSIPAANGNVNISAVGTANVLIVTGTGVNVAGTLNASGNANVGNLGTGGLIVATGNVTGGNLVTSGALSVTGNANVGNIGGNNAVFTLVTGTLTTAAQPNVTSVGTLSSLGVTGNVAAGNVYANSGTIGASLLTGTLTTAAQPNVTSVGTLSSLSVSGNANVGNIGATAGVFTGNISSLNANLGNLVTANIANLVDLNVSGNANIGGGSGGNISGANNITANTFTGTLTTAAQPNITSVGTLTSLGVNGTVTAVAFTANTGVFTGNGSGLSAIAGGNVTGQVANATVAGTVYTAAQPNITSVGTLSSLAVTGNVAAGNLTTTGVLSVTGTGVSSIAGNLDMTSNNIINLAPPVNSTDAATKQYVDDIAQGLHVHAPCFAATANTLAVRTGGTITYNNGTAGVGANLVLSGSPTANYTAANCFDGNVTAIVGSRILVKNEANAAHNGIYVVDSATVLTRATDFDTPTEMAGGDFTFVQNGDNYNDTGWVMTDPVTTVGTTPVTFVQFSGAGTYTAGTGLTLTGTVFSVNASQTQVTALGTVTSGTWNSIVGSSATFAAGLSGANLASITGANVTGQVGNALVAGTVYTAAQPNITSVGTLSSLGVNGTVTAVAFTANTGVFTGNGSGLSAIAGANVTGTVSSATTAGTVTTAAQPNITSVGTLTSLAVTGNITAGNLSVSAGAVTLGTLTTGSNTTAGTLTGNFTLSTGSRLQATYADLAEKYVADADYEEGTVLIFGGDQEVTISAEYDSHRVAGVVSHNAAYIMNSACEGEHVIDLALTGRVPVKVHGPVMKGDLMVTGPNGHAVANNQARAGTILGKALQNFEGGSGIIEVVVGRV